ncbi:MAG TPA: GH92 family glycosyl hydrolase [Paludibacter sp.]|nr:GH92 family glycosyl hydrolase [Paludibacter sp.]
MNRAVWIFVWVVFTSILPGYPAGNKDNSDNSQYVNAFIGTGGHGHSFLGVTTPFGAVQAGPSNPPKGWDWCSIYHYSDSTLMGFAHLHLNGTGCADGGDLLFLPYTSSSDMTESKLPEKRATYSHADEQCVPGCYSLAINNRTIKVELTASERVAFHRYTFTEGDKNKQVLINLKDACGNDNFTEGYLEQTDAKTIKGYRFTKGWSKSQQVFFAAIFSEPVKLVLYKDNKKVGGSKLTGLDVKGVVCLDKKVKELKVKVGISPVSTENAILNIEKEIDHWDFEAVVAETTRKWNDQLSKIHVETNDTDAKKIFYTGMYHTFMQPILFNDCNNDYRGTNKLVYPNAPFANYTIFSLWDTYRAANPLYTIVQPERVPDFIRSMLAIDEQQGRLPVWPLYGNDTNEMVGISSIPVIADAILKDFKGFDYEKAYNAMKRTMLMCNFKGLEYIRNLGYIPADKEGETVAKGMEYAINDGCIAQVARKLGKTEDYKLFAQRAKFYQNYWDKDTRFFRGKKLDGSWTTPFNPLQSKHRDDDYCEGTGWQYTWLVPHDVEGLIGLFGSEESFTTKLDSLFTLKYTAGNESSMDISGLIGQYAHGNEPGHHTVYLYAFAGQQWKTAEKVREILSSMYFNKPNGLPGNEDCGQMSSWYILSSLGFYPVNPANGIFVFGSPLFDKAVISLPGDKTFTVAAENNSDKNIYIQSVNLNGKQYPYSYIRYSDIMAGGELKFVMGNKANTQFGSPTEYRPKSEN